MQTNPTANKTTWFCSYHHVMKSKEVQVQGIISSLGQSDKILYCFMHSAYFSLKAAGREFFMTREVLGENCAMSARTVQRCVKVLEDSGLIEVDRRCKKGSPDQLNYYTVKHHSEALWDGVMYASSAKKVQKFYEEEDESMCPF